MELVGDTLGGEMMGKGREGTPLASFRSLSPLLLWQAGGGALSFVSTKREGCLPPLTQRPGRSSLVIEGAISVRQFITCEV